jgi:hypothetical protein
MAKKAIESKQKDYTVQVNFSDESKEKKLIKFITEKSKDEFVISAEELISLLMNQVNTETLSPLFVDAERINVVEVMRQIKCVVDRDIKKGEIINLNYIHPYPLEYAIIERAYKIAQINKDAPMMSLTAEYIEKIKELIKPEMEEFTKKFYKSFKQLDLKK